MLVSYSFEVRNSNNNKMCSLEKTSNFFLHAPIVANEAAAETLVAIVGPSSRILFSKNNFKNEFDYSYN